MMVCPRHASVGYDDGDDDDDDDDGGGGDEVMVNLL